MDEQRPYWAWAVSSVLHGGVLLILILGIARAPKFEDSQEAIPVETVSESQLSEIMNGERQARPAPQPPPQAEPAQPSPPAPPADPRKAETAPEPPPKPEPAPPTPPEKPEPAPTPKEASLPTPPERPKPPPEKPKAEPNPAPVFDPNAIAKLIAPKPAPASGSAASPSPQAATPQGLPRHDAPRMSVSMAAALDAWLTESYLNCWSPPPAMPEGDVYVAEIKVVFNPDGSLSARPVLLNPPTDPAWRAHAESAMRAVRRCDPLRVPPQYLPYFEQWKVETIHFDPREAQG